MNRGFRGQKKKPSNIACSVVSSAMARAQWTTNKMPSNLMN